MNRAGRVLLILGAVIALGAGFVVFVLLFMSQPKPPETPTTKLVIAYQNISARSEIMPEQVGVTEWPQSVPTPSGAFDDTARVVGKLATAPVSPGQPVTDRVLIDKGDLKDTHSNAALILEKGTVGVALPVSVKSSVAEAIQAGDRVDVIASFTKSSGLGSLVTQRLLADMLVMQVGNWPSPRADSKSQTSTGTTVLTLQLSEQDVLVLENAQQQAAAFTLVLRPAGDHDLVPLEPVTLDYINTRFGIRLTR